MTAGAALPAASVAVRVSALSPRASATPARVKAPVWLATVERFCAASAIVAPGSAVPRRVTTAAEAWVLPAAVASEAARSKVGAAGAWVSRVKTTSSGVEALPAASWATSRTVWAPSASVPPARLASRAAEIVKAPPAPSRLLRSV